MEIRKVDLPEQHYIYVEKEVPYGPQIAEAMGAAFQEIFAFVGQNGITPLSMPMSVYPAMPGELLTFHGGVLVSAEDAAKATGNVKAGALPAGPAMSVTHIGPYDRMNESHQALWKHMEENGIPAAMPVWEIYVDDPGETAPENLRTEIFRAIAAG